MPCETYMNAHVHAEKPKKPTVTVYRFTILNIPLLQ